eukprot:g31093.t1
MSGTLTTDMENLATASLKDCLPLQFGLSKVMCDLFCIDDAVRSGTTAVLSSLQDSHAALMTNLQALLDYQTQYLLWAIGTAVNPHPVALESEEVLAVPVLLKEIEEFPEKETWLLKFVGLFEQIAISTN